MNYRTAGERNFKNNRIIAFNNTNTARINTELANEIGFGQSIVLLQIEFLLVTEGEILEGELWLKISMQQLAKKFPYWSQRQLERIVKSLREKRLLRVGNYNETPYLRTNWYALDREGISKLKSIRILESGLPFRQNGGMDNNEDEESSPTNWRPDYKDIKRVMKSDEEGYDADASYPRPASPISTTSSPETAKAPTSLPMTGICVSREVEPCSPLHDEGFASSLSKVGGNAERPLSSAAPTVSNPATELRNWRQPPDEAQKDMFSALCWLCGFPYRPSDGLAKQVNKAIRELRDMGVTTAQQILDWGEIWGERHWLGRKGELPMINTIVPNWFTVINLPPPEKVLKQSGYKTAAEKKADVAGEYLASIAAKRKRAQEAAREAEERALAQQEPKSDKSGVEKMRAKFLEGEVIEGEVID